MSTFVSVGNAQQPFARLLAAIAALAHELPHPIVVQRGRTPFSCGHCEVVEFLDMDGFVAHIETATVVILHAGAGSVLHARRAGKTPIIMPRRARYGEHVDDHQVEFARAVDEIGRAVWADTAAELRRAALDAPGRQPAVTTTPAAPPALVSLVGVALRGVLDA